MSHFLKIAGDLSSWNIYRKSAVVCDVTEMFIRRAFPYQTRTIDQMRQATRSCKQNIVEGVSDATISMEMAIKLIGVACGSLRELKEDYLDFLHQNQHSVWDKGNPLLHRCRQFCIECDDRDIFTAKCRDMGDDIVANIMMTEICQLDAMLSSLLKKLEDEFVKQGGLKEQMGQVRREWRKENLGY